MAWVLETNELDIKFAQFLNSILRRESFVRLCVSIWVLKAQCSFSISFRKAGYCRCSHLISTKKHWNLLWYDNLHFSETANYLSSSYSYYIINKCIKDRAPNSSIIALKCQLYRAGKYHPSKYCSFRMILNLGNIIFFEVKIALKMGDIYMKLLLKQFKWPHEHFCLLSIHCNARKSLVLKLSCSSVLKVSRQSLPNQRKSWNYWCLLDLTPPAQLWVLIKQVRVAKNTVLE